MFRVRTGGGYVNGDLIGEKVSQDAEIKIVRFEILTSRRR